MMFADYLRILAAGLIILGALAIVALLALDASGGDRDVHLIGVASEDLNESGIDLLQPADDAVARISDQVAIDAALRDRPGAVVRETALIELRQDQAGFTVSRLAWAVNLDPASVEAQEVLGGHGSDVCPSTGHPEYAVVFIDAHSGDLVFDMQKNRLPQLKTDGDCPPFEPDSDDGPAPTPVPRTSRH